MSASAPVLGAKRTREFTSTGPSWPSELLLPRLERFGERALTWRAFFYGEDGAAVVVVDHRHVDPSALVQRAEDCGLCQRPSWTVE
jgi:hypothetical protein